MIIYDSIFLDEIKRIRFFSETNDTESNIFFFNLQMDRTLLPNQITIPAVSNDEDNDKFIFVFFSLRNVVKTVRLFDIFTPLPFYWIN